MFRKLRDRGGTPAVSLVKDHLRRDGLLEDGKIPEDLEVYVERVDNGAYLVRAVSPDGDLPNLDEPQ
jgi:hypothetical protein